VRRLGIPLFFLALAALATWPLAVSPGRAPSVRADYFLNLWNFWWVDRALLQGRGSLLWTDYLHYPLGISLARHELSFVNSIPAAVLARALGDHDAFKLLLVLHYALAGWFAFLLAREVSGSRAGALLAGILWALAPFHTYYATGLNGSATGFLPLLLFFQVRLWRGGGRASALGFALAAALLAGSHAYYLVYGVALGLLLVAGGRLWAPETALSDGLRRLAPAVALAALAAGAVAWPLLSASLSGGAQVYDAGAATAHMAARSNDLYGYLWIGGPEELLVSWPTMLGWTAVAVIAGGLARDRRCIFWLGLAALFALLSLGPSLHVGRADTGLALPYRLLVRAPGLQMLRKPDRMIAVVTLAVAVQLALAWPVLARRLDALRPGSARWLLPVVALLLALELRPAPFATFALERAPLWAELAADESTDALVELPLFGGDGRDGRANLHQLDHEKKIPQGYVIGTALTPANGRATRQWLQAELRLGQGNARPLVRRAQETGVDLIAIAKTAPEVRAPLLSARGVLWLPFAFVRGPLVEMRQRGHLEDRPVPPAELEVRLSALRAELGPPQREDEHVAVFRVP